MDVEECFFLLKTSEEESYQRKINIHPSPLDRPPPQEGRIDIKEDQCFLEIAVLFAYYDINEVYTMKCLLVLFNFFMGHPV